MITYFIDILDRQGKKFGELPTATQEDIRKFINKGFTVIDKSTGIPFTEDNLSSMIGVSECIIDMG